MHCLVAAPIAMLSILISLHVAWGTEITVSATRFFSIPLAVYDQTGFYVGANADRAWSITDCAFFIGASSDPTSQNSPTCIVGAQLGYLYELDPNWAVGLEVSWSGTIKASKHDQFVSSGLQLRKLSNVPIFKPWRGCTRHGPNRQQCEQDSALEVGIA